MDVLDLSVHITSDVLAQREAQVKRVHRVMLMRDIDETVGMIERHDDTGDLVLVARRVSVNDIAVHLCKNRRRYFPLQRLTARHRRLGIVWLRKDGPEKKSAAPARSANAPPNRRVRCIFIPSLCPTKKLRNAELLCRRSNGSNTITPKTRG